MCMIINATKLQPFAQNTNSENKKMSPLDKIISRI